MRSTKLFIVLCATLFALMETAALAQERSSLCRADQTDTSDRLAPDVLVPRLARTFEVDPTGLRGTSYIRCARGQLIGCITGANLNCGRANVSRHSAGADSFCRGNPRSQVVPMAATGHDTVYDWHCVGTHAVAGALTEPVDRLGFMTRNWRSVH